MRTILTTAVLATALMAAPAAHAFGLRGGGFFGRGGGPGGPGGRGGPAGPMLRLLASDMTPPQRAQVRAILVANRGEMRDILRQLHAAHNVLRDRMLAAGPLTDQDLQPDLEKIDALHRRLLEHGAKVMLGVRAVATPEQLAKAAQTMKRVRELKDEMRTLLGGGPDGDDEADGPQ